MHQFIKIMPRRAKWAILLAMDMLLAPIALFASYTLQNNSLSLINMPLLNLQNSLVIMCTSGLIAIVISSYKIQLKAYEIRAIGMTAVHAILLGLSLRILGDLVNAAPALIVFIMFTLVFFLLAVVLRFLILQILLIIYRGGKSQVRVLIYGAGSTGRQLAAALRTDETIRPIAFLDENPILQGNIVQGLKVYSPKLVETLKKSRRIDRVLLAMPTAPQPQLALLSQRLKLIGLKVQALPSFSQMAHGNGFTDQVEPVNSGRFLGREALDGDMLGGAATYAGRVVLISGAGGSIGSELCRQILVCGPAKIVLVEVSEPALYTINMQFEILAEKTSVIIVPVLGSVCDSSVMRQVLSDHKVQLVIHAAAYKHVSLVEQNPIVGVSNNVIGTQTLAQASADAGVELFILISTDKAVRPLNVMGASKRLAEIVIQDMACRANSLGAGKTLFSIVRFGNVIGSSGSVIPLFRRQISKGGPITLTHNAATRYFMTTPEAARLVLLAGSFATGGDVFVLKMGDPVSIYDLARQMICDAGYTLLDEDNPDGDIEIVLIGLRPGEKIHEELLIDDIHLTELHPKVMRAREPHLSELEVAFAMNALHAAIAASDVAALRDVITRWVESGTHLTPTPNP